MKKYLIARLGNTGTGYASTRHNIDFLVAGKLAKDRSVSFITRRLGDLAEIKVKGRTFTLLRPSTYMNLSGKAVCYWLEKERLTAESPLVVYDNPSIKFGALRIKGKGSDGGHNELKDVQYQLDTQKHVHLRFGIGNNFESGRQIDYVLGEWTPEEQTLLPKRAAKCAGAILLYDLTGLAITTNAFNNK